MLFYIHFILLLPFKLKLYPTYSVIKEMINYSVHLMWYQQKHACVIVILGFSILVFSKMSLINFRGTPSSLQTMWDFLLFHKPKKGFFKDHDLTIERINVPKNCRIQLTQNILSTGINLETSTLSCMKKFLNEMTTIIHIIYLKSPEVRFFGTYLINPFF